MHAKKLFNPGWSAMDSCRPKTASSGCGGAGPSPAVASEERRVILAGTPDETIAYVNHAEKKGPTILVTGGVHGNEVSGWVVAYALRNFRIKRGTLVVVPCANRRAVKCRARYATGDRDLNRLFPVYPGDKCHSTLASGLWSFIVDLKPQWILDLHEGIDYNANNPDSVGQTVICYGHRSVHGIGSSVVGSLNETITHPRRKFRLINGDKVGSMGKAAAEALGLSGMVLETCMRDHISQRTTYHLKMVYLVLIQLGLLPAQDWIPTPGVDPACWPRTIARSTPYSTLVHRVRSGRKGPRVLVVGGVHGSKKSGLAAARMVAAGHFGLSRGTLYIIPEANLPAIIAGKRCVDNIDLNRQFPFLKGANAQHPLAQSIIGLITEQNIDYVVDLHEGSDYRAAGSDGFGNVIISPNTKVSCRVAKEVVSALNASTFGQGPVRLQHQFVHLKSPIEGGLVRSCGDCFDVGAIHVSPSTKEPLDVRVDYHLHAIEAVLFRLKMGGRRQWLNNASPIETDIVLGTPRQLTRAETAPSGLGDTCPS